jgi:hypothetical protein
MTCSIPKKALLAAGVLGLCVSSSADARNRSFGDVEASTYQSNGKLGLGVELGAPSGLNGKYFLTPSTALNFGLGWLADYYYRDGNGVHLYLDHLWHPKSLVETEAFKLPFFVGVGGRFWSFGHDGLDRSSAAGVRVPVGVVFDFNKIPLDAFVAFTFGIDMFFGDYASQFSRVGVELGATIGARYWFD